MTMRPLTLDFIRPAFPLWPGMLVLAIGSGFALGGYLQYQSASDRAEEAALRLEKLRGSASRLASGGASPKVLSKETEAGFQQAQQVADFLLLPWNNLFAALETAALDDVALLAIEPDPRKRQVRISAEAKDGDTLFAYLKRLEKVSQLKDVHLLRHEVREDDSQHPVRFTVAAQWTLQR